MEARWKLVVLAGACCALMQASGFGYQTTGADECTSAHPTLPAGDMFGYPFVTGTTGSQGQSEQNCGAPGFTGISNDVWFDWTATATGTAELTTCTFPATADTKVAVYPFLGSASCPIDGSSLTCNDDSCAPLSTVSWPCTSGQTYTIQIGCSPGTPGGVGLFDIQQFPPIPVSVWFCGFENTSLGQAVLQVDPTGMTISNIGPGRSGGVSISYGQANGMAIDVVGLPDPTVDPALTTMQFVGTHNGGSHTTSLSYTAVAGVLRARADFAQLTPSAKRVEVFLAGQPVANVVHTGTTDMVYLPPVPATTETTICTVEPRGCCPGDATVAYVHVGDPGAPATVMLPDGTTVVGDYFQFSPVNAASAVTSSSGMDLNLTNRGARVEKELVQLFRVMHGGLGQARLAAQSGTLVVQNIGSSGQDGVRTRLPDATSAGLHWADLASGGPHPPGAELAVRARGTMAGVPDSDLGTIRVIQTAGSDKRIEADYSQSGATSFLVDVYDAGQLVTSLQGHTGTIALVADWPDGCDKLDQWPQWGVPCYRKTWGQSTQLTIPGHGTFAGDELRVLAEGAQLVESISETELLLLGIPELVLTDVEFELPPPEIGTPVCFGDGSGAPCGCTNESAPGSGGGCHNSLGIGAVLSAHGTADTANDTMTLICTGVRAQPGLFFQGNLAIAGGAGIPFGDGIRCCGQGIVRLEVVSPSPPQPATAEMTERATTNGPPGTIQPGDTKCYQYWYRDSTGSPCSSYFNLSNAVLVTWS